MDPRSAEIIEGEHVLVAQNIEGAPAPVPPLFLRPCALLASCEKVRVTKKATSRRLRTSTKVLGM